CAWHVPCIASRIATWRSSMKTEIAVDDIRLRAYALWEARGRPSDSGGDDWREAERQLREELDAAASPLSPVESQAADAVESGAVRNTRAPARGRGAKS